MNHNDYLDADFLIISLYNIVNGECECGNPECNAKGKHPRMANWQLGVPWSEEQIENMEKFGLFDTGFGALCNGYLVIDIDPRNGGDKSYEQLCKDTGLDYKKESGFVVATGGGGWHIYFKAPEGVKLAKGVKQYPGVDFKSSGFVVGCGSLHASGGVYEAEKGHPCDIDEPPAKLIGLLDQSNYKAEFACSNGAECSTSEIKDMLSHISPDASYEEWVAIGMAIHHSTDGDGLCLWDEWSSGGSTYNRDEMSPKWHSFGKSQDPVTIGTLKKIAEENGYKEPVTFTPTIIDVESKTQQEIPEYDLLDTTWVSLQHPPGLIGKMARHMSDSAFRVDKENLAVGASLYAASISWGMQHQPSKLGMLRQPALNLFVFAVAPSGSGKNHMDNMISRYAEAAGAGMAVHKGIKSEQEIIKNMISNELSAYVIDEWGLMLRKMDPDSKNTAAYLQGVSMVLMNTFSNVGGYLNANSDHTAVEITRLKKLIGECERHVEENNRVELNTAKLKRYKEKLAIIDERGIPSGYIGLYGGTTPETFDSLMTYQMAQTGFVGRALIFEDKDPAPETKFDALEAEIPEHIRHEFISISACGYSDPLRCPYTKEIYFQHEKKKVPYSDECVPAAIQICKYFDHVAKVEANRRNGGFNVIYNRSAELCFKVAWLLAIGDGGKLELKHLQWAFALAKADAEQKLTLVKGNAFQERKERGTELVTKLQNKMSKTVGMTAARARNRFIKFSEEDIQKGLTYLVEEGLAVEDKTGKAVKYFLA